MFDVEKINSSTLTQLGSIIGLQKSQVANLRAGKREVSAMEVILLNEHEDNLILRFFNWQADEILFWNNLESLQSMISKPDAQMAELFSLDQRTYRFNRAKAKSLPWRACEYFHQRYKIHPVMWFTHDIDIDCLAKNMNSPFKSNAYLPASFEGGGSRMRTFANTVLYARKTWGNEVANALLASMQITQDSLSFPEKSISICVFASLHQKLRQFGAQDQHFIEMGSNNVMNEINRRLFAQHIPKNCKTMSQVLSYFADHLVAKIDTNKIYKVIESNETFLNVLVTPTQSFKESFNELGPYSEYEIALFTKGHMIITPTYFGFKPFLKVELEYNDETGAANYKAFYS
ncbi:MAG: hypothetical protein CME71_03570 [Halobacteriovorax sp.]|nr:hypothetical protein [Halobacteriovorax sp.]|tara:strand:+ start:741 stop:1778 length:1038 start_codon:yes stop_codon:yes gene_type:complete